MTHHNNSETTILFVSTLFPFLPPFGIYSTWKCDSLNNFLDGCKYFHANPLIYFWMDQNTNLSTHSRRFMPYDFRLRHISTTQISSLGFPNCLWSSSSSQVMLRLVCIRLVDTSAGILLWGITWDLLFSIVVQYCDLHIPSLFCGCHVTVILSLVFFVSNRSWGL